jgi:hypothetical protein
MKAASKEGIVSGAIEGVLKELVGDDLVHEEKISGTLFYWSFPGEVATKKRAELAAAHAEVARQQAQISELQEQTEALRRAQGQSQAEAQELRAQELLLVEVRARETERRAEAETLRKAAGQNMHARKRDLGVLRDAANRWTDNLFELKKHCVETCGFEPKVVDEMLGTDRIDYVE